MSGGFWLLQVYNRSLALTATFFVLLVRNSAVLHELSQHFKAGQAPAHIHYESFISIFCKT